ncbi:MAG TPA: YsnF/AvaK domain-containing protein [Microvirga sp.]|jgi:uncharacterized protein (TIGR02271 family)|nr:YsnF/AvaK domain-containing protein [Microvirga sp.]
MSKTVTSLFHDQQQAHSAVSRLEQAGISRSGIEVFTNSSGDLTDDLRGYGVPDRDAHAYSEGLRRGGALVAVSCDDDDVQRVISLLDDGALDLDEQQNSWRSEGWQDHTSSRGLGVGGSGMGSDTHSGSGMGSGLGAAAAGIGAALTGSSGSDRTGDMTGSSETTRSRADMDLGTDTTRGTGDQVIPIAEEELHVGKREVSHGRVRIHSHVVERPVQEQVTLRDETVQVERRAATGDMRSGTLSGDPFQERTIEVEERDEQAVVSKEARVTEELVVHKDVEQRTETVSDTVRRTEVDVEDERGVRGTGTTGTTDRSRS